MDELKSMYPLSPVTLHIPLFVFLSHTYAYYHPRYTNTHTATIQWCPWGWVWKYLETEGGQYCNWFHTPLPFPVSPLVLPPTLLSPSSAWCLTNKYDLRPTHWRGEWGKVKCWGNGLLLLQTDVQCVFHSECPFITEEFILILPKIPVPEMNRDGIYMPSFCKRQYPY